ncbi:unnamed protein product [Rotaria sordida]|uniref:Uncharacterized protein n=2 Tax=Rotaria sordida TaxID=392033 RepID=A0A819RM38_9BILA|nr:unnamed protein product [Rotaria sordida]CAF1277571.1 unnamed protein product [Rotaria sordida]CAF4042997.1 unnamed protein product [Rotaria sordida]
MFASSVPIKQILLVSYNFLFTANGKYTCSYCIFKTTTRADWMNHMEKTHPKEFQKVVNDQKNSRAALNAGVNNVLDEDDDDDDENDARSQMMLNDTTTGSYETAHFLQSSIKSHGTASSTFGNAHLLQSSIKPHSTHNNTFEPAHFLHSLIQPSSTTSSAFEPAHFPQSSIQRRNTTTSTFQGPQNASVQVRTQITKLYLQLDKGDISLEDYLIKIQGLAEAGLKAINNN